MIKSFRGELADGGQDTIRLSTNDGLTGYRILKFQIFPILPGTTDVESTVQIFKDEQSSVSTTSAEVHFNNPNLLGASYMAEGSGADQGPLLNVIVFDSEIFNQDIFITHTDTTGTREINYYLELEQVKLDLSEASVATLKDMRGTN